MAQEKEKQQRYASKILTVGRNAIITRHPFLARAAYGLRDLPTAGAPYGTDGKYFRYDPETLIADYVDKRIDVEYLWLHSTLHCLYMHPFIIRGKSRLLWNAACDIYIWHILALLQHPGPQDMSGDRSLVLQDLEKQVRIASAQSIYRFLRRQGNDYRIRGWDLEALSLLFGIDDHSCWYAKAEDSEEEDEGKKDKEDKADKEGTEGKEGKEEKADKEDNEYNEGNDSGTGASASGQGKAAKSGNDNGENEEIRSRTNAEQTGVMQESREKDDVQREIERWADIAQHAEAGLMVRLAECSQDFVSEAGSLVESIRNIERENYNYSEFLKKFAVLEERMHLDLDSFDYIYYTYGMELYRDTPLIEPLEYKELKTIHEFVIAIDTSGSCSADLVKKFLVKTYDILCTETVFEGELKVYIIQCDACIQHETVITCPEELNTYMEQFVIIGRGGTDFRPVFKRIQELREEGALTDIRGLLYFTDGYGTYPSDPADYKTAFVFVESDRRAEVPSWAMSVYIEEEMEN